MPRASAGPDGGAPAARGDGGEGGDLDGYQISNAMGIQEEARLYPFFSALWKKIDASAGYPDDFVKERITGYVTAQLEVDRRGVFTGKIARLNSDRPPLETYVLAVLFHALSEPLPAKLWSGREKIVLVSHFDFHTFTYGESPPPRVQKELKNVLEFERYGYNDPKLNQIIERFVTHYLPPFIPVPGGFYIDFFRAAQLLSNLRGEHKLDADELRLERVQLKHEQWQDVVRREATGAP